MGWFEDRFWDEHPKWPYVCLLNIHSFWWPGPEMVFAYNIERFALPEDRPFEFKMMNQLWLTKGEGGEHNGRRLSTGDG